MAGDGQTNKEDRRHSSLSSNPLLCQEPGWVWKGLWVSKHLPGGGSPWRNNLWLGKPTFHKQPHGHRAAEGEQGIEPRNKTKTFTAFEQRDAFSYINLQREWQTRGGFVFFCAVSGEIMINMRSVLQVKRPCLCFAGTRTVEQVCLSGASLPPCVHVKKPQSGRFWPRTEINSHWTESDFIVTRPHSTNM